MLADNPSYNREAAAQVAHAITTHKVTVEDDYYTAVDDLKTPAEDAGAGFLGEAAFGSGVFYLYLCVDRTLLIKNLGGDDALAGTAWARWPRLRRQSRRVASRTASPPSAARRYILAERGNQQPRTLAGAFAQPGYRRQDLMANSIKALRAFRSNLDAAYCVTPEPSAEMEVGGSGTLADIIAFFRSSELMPRYLTFTLVAPCGLPSAPSRSASDVLAGTAPADPRCSVWLVPVSGWSGRTMPDRRR